MKKTFLITGATGYLGKQLCLKLTEEKHQVIALKRSSSDERHFLAKPNIEYHDFCEKKIDHLFNHYSLDMIIHCATNYNVSLEHATDTLKTNVILPLHLLQSSFRTQQIPFINIGTVLDPAISIYALSKHHFSEWLFPYSSHFACIDLSLSHFYGPFDDDKKICTNIIRSLLNEVDEIKLTAGEQKRDFIYISDVITAIYLFINRHSSNEPGYYHHNVGTGIKTKLKDFVCFVRDIIGNQKTKLQFGAFNYRPHEVFEYDLNFDSLFQLGWKPHYDLISGLKETIAKELTRV